MNRVGLVSMEPVPDRSLAPLEAVVGAERYRRLCDGAVSLRKQLAGRRIWNVSSTAVGGGVAEMLQGLVGYVGDLDIPIEWAVIGADPEVFAITKRLHNRIHGDVGDGEPLGTAQAAHYSGVLAANAAELVPRVRPGDLVLLHDPQTAGLTGALVRAGA